MLARQERRIAAALSGAPANLLNVHRWAPDGTISPDPGLRLQQHTGPSVLYTLWGRLRVRLPGGIRELAPGRAVVLLPGVWHRLLDPTAEAIGLHLRANDGRIRVSGFARGAALEAWPRDGGSLATLALEADRHRRRQLLADLVVDLLEAPGPRQDPRPPAVAAMVGAGERNLHLGIDARDLVAASGLATAQAYRLFGRHLGTPPRAWLEDRRLALAASLLAAGYRIGDAARQCGFASRVHCSRAWRRRHGAPPRESRRQ